MWLMGNLIYVGIVSTQTRDTDLEYAKVWQAFLDVYVEGKTIIVSGGGDRIAELIATSLGLPFQRLYSNVPDTDMDGPRMMIHMPDIAAFAHVPSRWRSTQANYARNSYIARGAMDHLIACVAADTEDTIRKWKIFHGKEPILV